MLREARISSLLSKIFGSCKKSSRANGISSEYSIIFLTGDLCDESQDFKTRLHFRTMKVQASRVFPAWFVCTLLCISTFARNVALRLWKISHGYKKIKKNGTQRQNQTELYRGENSCKTPI